MEREVIPLADACLTQIERQETVLGELRETLLAIRGALLRYDMNALTHSLARQAERVRAAEEIHQHWENARNQAAVAVGVAPKTLGILAGQLNGEAAEQVLCGRERLRRLHAEIERLNRENAVLVRHGLDFLRHLLVAITGGTPGGSGYGPAGSPREGVCGSLLQARG